MGNETLAVIVWVQRDQLADTFHLKVVRVDTSEEVHLREGGFLLRISQDADTAVERCFIRHIASGEEAYLQSGPNLRTFINNCLLDTD